MSVNISSGVRYTLYLKFLKLCFSYYNYYYYYLLLLFNRKMFTFFLIFLSFLSVNQCDLLKRIEQLRKEYVLHLYIYFCVDVSSDLVSSGSYQRGSGRSDQSHPAAAFGPSLQTQRNAALHLRGLIVKCSASLCTYMF